jgi:16S rRNA (guanine1207-N2)-methyltransferase
MTEQYFTGDPQSKSNPEPLDIAFMGHALSFVTDAGIFSKGELDLGSRILLTALPENLKGRILDLGCGWGAIGIMIGVCHPEATIVMSDVNKRALSLASANAAHNGLAADCFLSDGFMNIPGDFDIIVTNPPIRAGKQTIYRMFSACGDRLKPDGTLYIVIRKQQGASSAQAYLQTIFTQVSLAAKSKGYWVIKCQGAKDGV